MVSSKPEYWVTATQPVFFPYMHMIERFARCHEVILLCEAQYTKTGNHSSVRISTPAQGDWLRVQPLGQKNRTPIRDIPLLDPVAWSQKAWAQLSLAYAKAPYAHEVLPSLKLFFEHVTARDWMLDELNIATLRWLFAQFDISPKLVKASGLVPIRPDEPTEWLAALAFEAGATDYVQGEASIRDYWEPGVFAEKGIRAWGQTCTVPKYETRGVYQPMLSAMDLLVNVGREKAQDLLQVHAGTGQAAGTVVHMEGY